VLHDLAPLDLLPDEYHGAVGRDVLFNLAFLFNFVSEKAKVTKDFGSGALCDNVASHAWSPLNFPLTEYEAKTGLKPRARDW
jgi:hypothetical protein